MKKINWKALKRNVKVAALKLRKHSPEIMVIAGCTGTVVGTVMACKKTLELEDTLDEVKNDICEVKSNEESGNKELTIAYVKGAGKVAKLYAPAVLVSGMSIGMIFGSNNIMKKRNAAACAAYATVESMYRKYRQNVIDKYGEEEDFNMRFGARKETIEEVVTDGKGKSKVVKKKETVVDDFELPSEYARWFDESCKGWDKDPEYNLMFLDGVRKMCERKLIANGYLFLNDVYAALGIPETWAGQFVGWIYDKDNPVGDNKVDFRIHENVERKRAFVNGYEPNILLDFNVDGDIVNDERLKIYMPVI